MPRSREQCGASSNLSARLHGRHDRGDDAMKAAEVLVIGAGPAGIAAATAAAEHGLRTIVLDDNPSPGGQIWRSGIRTPSRKSATRDRALEQLARSGAELLCGYRVFDVENNTTILAAREVGEEISVTRFQYEQLVLATGAHERFLPFPGWTLPGVFGAGGLQALVQGGYLIDGKRIVVAGTGPLLLAVAAHLVEYGARIVCVAEQAPASKLIPFSLSLWKQPAKILQGARYRTSVWEAPYRIACWPSAASPSDDGRKLRAVTLTDGKRTWEQPCDLLACGFHLVPNTELAVLLGCALQDEFVQVDAQQRTSLPNVFCVGEPTGIAGVDAALVQGEIAGLTCAGRPTKHLHRRAQTERMFGRRLAKTFALRQELTTLATPETLVCRCEDVPMSKLIGLTDWTHAKLQTRCGMGPCQGRICGPALQSLFGWKPVSVRPPLFPVPLEALCSTESHTHSRSNA
jgi:NADPH-dependent 2,4-dienoyl-CoA reductase/sulfur reductase-like enzyme